jgi:flagellar biosynthetic protein FliR
MPTSHISGGIHLGASDLVVPQAMVLHFLLVLFRVGGIFAFIPFPGIKSALAPTRIMLVVLMSIVVFPLAPAARGVTLTLSGAFSVLLSEVSLGLLIGLAIQALHEGVILGAQALSIQAGYSYASTVDPNSEADSSVLQVMLGLSASLVFLALGLDRMVLKAILTSFQAYSPGAFLASRAETPALVALTGELFSQGLRIASPIVGVLLLVDVAMALLSRLQPQMQLLNLSFPLKMLLSLAGLAVSIQMMPHRILHASEGTFRFIEHILTGSRG